jgi:Glycerol dehydrogenase and related enzymes
MLEFITSPVNISGGATAAARVFISDSFGCAENTLAVCDTNTEAIVADAFPGIKRFVFLGNIIADPELAVPLEKAARGKRALVAVGSGTVHDLTRYVAHKLGLPFVSYPTAPSVDGFVSGIAAMTISGQKLSFPSSPPTALFADPAVFMSAPAALIASGVGDLLGKYISLLDWKISNILTGERWDEEIAALEQSAVDKLIKTEPGSREFGLLLMDALVTSGLAIQAYGSSRPASGSEHHLSHLWEMHCINSPTPALHGEKVGVSTLLLLERYRVIEHFTLRKNIYTRDYLAPVYGALTDGIIKENLPDPLGALTQRILDNAQPQLIKALCDLPDPGFMRDYMSACGCKPDLASIGLPDSDEFLRLTLEFAPYVRKRVTMLKVCVIC